MGQLRLVPVTQFELASDGTCVGLYPGNPAVMPVAIKLSAPLNFVILAFSMMPEVPGAIIQLRSDYL